ncbi:PRC-barrel domain-containing protein [Bacillus testis]|uniref:PRC-barrel domain-containing protein n=1 Tax=Bacillus testis TaxID=1622072 RepID=UPI00084122C4|nr:PRC-barrel domain-containing protein [Bacillus testis]
MRTLSLLDGMPVYDNGTIIGHVSDLVISDGGSVLGLLMDMHSPFKKAKLLPLQDVAAFGKDGLAAKQESLLPFKRDQVYTLRHQRDLTGKKIINDHGEDLGFLEDVYFSEQLGTIVAYEISNGFFSDLRDGKQMISVHKPPSLGKDAIIISTLE